jgi:predicted MPP superfamily phosphohydrolase
MFHKSLVILAYVLGMAGLSLAFLSQRYWFARAWRFAGRIHAARLRKAARGTLLTMLVVVAAVALFRVGQNMRGIITRGSWWWALFGFWFSSSILSYVLIKMIAGADWMWRRWQRRSGQLEVSPAPAAPSESVRTHERIDHSRRHFVHAAGFLAGAVPFVSFAYGFVSERFRFEVRDVEIPIANLPAALDGFRITQVSDIHIGSYMPVSQIRRAVGMANELGADLTVVTGDFLTTRTDPLEDCIAELSRLRAPLGVWGCNGNHEIYAKAEAEAASLFQRYGMRLLRQEHAELKWHGGALNLIGVDYQRQRDPDGNTAPMLVGVDHMVRHDIPNVLLSHNPNSFPRAAELGIQLSLAGHTHGGQVRVEILDHRWSPARFLTPYVAGLYQRPLLAPEHLSDAEVGSLFAGSKPAQIYVNRGLGTIGAPVRLGVPPEISLITLRRA